MLPCECHYAPNCSLLSPKLCIPTLTMQDKLQPPQSGKLPKCHVSWNFLSWLESKNCTPTSTPHAKLQLLLQSCLIGSTNFGRFPAPWITQDKHPLSGGHELPKPKRLPMPTYHWLLPEKQVGCGSICLHQSHWSCQKGWVVEPQESYGFDGHHWNQSLWIKRQNLLVSQETWCSVGSLMPQ